MDQRMLPRHGQLRNTDAFNADEQQAEVGPESYVDPDQAAAFLKTNRLQVIRMARSGFLPAHPLGDGKRRQWRFKLSELDKHMQRGLNGAHPPVRQ